MNENSFDDLFVPKASKLKTVAQFFKGKNVFITGATGFMGKVLVEKLLWTCEDIGNIYLLIRPKKGCLPSKRIEDLLKLPVFDRLKEKNPKCFSKLIPIVGDVMEQDLGIYEKDKQLLQSTVSIVFHVASSVRFDDPLKKAILLNVRGTRDVLELSKKMENLEVLVYVSTSYCNCDKQIIEERVYPSDIDWKMLIKVAESNNENILNIIQPKILMKRPNTYTFTKFMAENIINDYAAEIPSVIFRPSIVTFCIEEPIPGWVDNLNGPIGLGVGVASGVLRVLYGDANCIPDYMPCDRAINGLIISAWLRGVSKSNKCQVINGATGDKKKTSTNFINQFADETIRTMPLSRILWYPSFLMTKNKTIYYLMILFTHIIPAIFLDFIFRLKGMNLSLMQMYRKIFIANNAVAYFICNDWQILTSNYESMKNYMTKDDQETFKYNIDDINEVDALKLGMYGCKKYIFKEDVSDAAIKADKIYLNRLYWIDRTLKIAGFIIMVWYFFRFNLNHFFR